MPKKKSNKGENVKRKIKRRTIEKSQAKICLELGHKYGIDADKREHII